MDWLLNSRSAELVSTIASVTGDDVRFVPLENEVEIENEHTWDVRGASGERYGVLAIRSKSEDIPTHQNELYNQLSQIIADEIELRRQNLSLEERFRLVDRQNVELSAVNRALSEMAYRDPLTGLYRRWYLDEQFRLELSRSVRYGRNFSLLLIDIDNFKEINDRWGHKAGDVLLKVVSRNLQQSVRNSDVLCRYGGDEFSALLTDTPLAGATEVAERIRTRCENATANWETEQLKITVSIGLGSFGEDWNPGQSGPEEIFEKIDQAMYAAKKDGRNRVRLMADLETAAAKASP